MIVAKALKRPRAKKLVQGRLPFTVVANKTDSSNVPKSPEPKKDQAIKVSDDESLPTKKTKHKDEMKSISPILKNNDAEVVSVSDAEMVDSNNGDEAANQSENEEDTSILDTSNTSTTSSKKMTPKQVEKLKKKEERDRKKAEERAEKERQKQEKLEEKRRKDEEKELEKKKKEEEKKRKEEEREAEKRKKEEEKKRKEEEKEAEKRRREEEKKRKEEEKEAEKKRKEEEERRKKERLSQVFTSFFTQKKSVTKAEDCQTSTSLAFPPFQVKENMRLAPILRSDFTSERRKRLEELLGQTKPEKELYLVVLNHNKGVQSSATWPLNKDDDLEIIDEDDVPGNKEDVVITSSTSGRRKLKAKLLQFCDNRRPPYWGTWRKTSSFVKPRRPLGKDVILDYEVDSDDEWEEEEEPGESLTDSEGEDKEPADEYEVDNEFFVPHGYLSEEEADEDEQPLSPSAAKERLKLKEQQFEKELKEKTCPIKPSLIGCYWQDDEEQPQLLKVLQQYAAILCTAAPVSFHNDSICDAGESPTVDDSVRSDKANKRRVNESDVGLLVKILHGSLQSKATIVREFLSVLEQTRPNERPGPSKAQIVVKIGEIASWTKCNEQGPMNSRMCWIVHPEVLERCNLTELPIVNTWEYTIDVKKKGRKIEETKCEEEPNTHKSPRVSLITKFTQQIPSENGVQLKEAEVNTPRPKKRVALISLPTSATKKAKLDSIASPLTNFLKKMEPKQAESLNPADTNINSESENPVQDDSMSTETSCITLD